MHVIIYLYAWTTHTHVVEAIAYNNVVVVKRKDSPDSTNNCKKPSFARPKL